MTYSTYYREQNKVLYGREYIATCASIPAAAASAKTVPPALQSALMIVQGIL